MADPNFSESQLQSDVNSALVRYVWEQYQVWILPNIVSLHNEYYVGWDSAFLVPWLPTGDPDQEGCNLFIQYKLSEKLKSSGAAQWADWGEPYYRFQIPHSTLDDNDKYVDDYHQWKSLLKLSKSGYATFYVTNHTLSKHRLRKHHDSGELLDRVAWLDLEDVTKKHRHVTFTELSSFFYLHSEIEKVKRTEIRETLSVLSEKYPQRSMFAANRKLIDDLQESNITDDQYHQDISRILESSQRTDSPRGSLSTHILLRSFVHRHLGSTLVWVPRLAG